MLHILNFRIGKPNFRFYTENGIFYAENNSRKTFFSLIFFGMLSLFIFAGFFLLKDAKEISLELIFIGFVIHPLFGIIGIRKFLWLIRGKEIITIDNLNLKITKSGSFWFKDRVFEKKEIKNIRDKFDDELYSKNRSEWFNKRMNSIKEHQRTMLGITIGEILFDYKFSKIEVFSCLNESERKILLNELKKQIEK
ncbi:MAG: hypothetical protein H7250_12895 [Flavobacterium sp.]|nr:hypothetical protein [Flavobacterium sp.]